MQTGCHPEACDEFQDAARCNEARWCRWSDAAAPDEASCEVRRSQGLPVPAYFDSPCSGSDEPTCGEIGGCRWGSGCEGVVLECWQIMDEAACNATAPRCGWYPTPQF